MRASAAFLALAAAVLFVVSLVAAVFPASPLGGWWDGHPDVAGKTFEAKDVHVGMLGATGCDTGGDGKCRALDVDSQLELVGIPAIAIVALAGGFAFVLAMAAWRVGDRRKAIAKITLGLAALAAIAGALVIVQGSSIRASQ